MKKKRPKVVFQTLSGDLAVERHGDLYEMDFPAYELKSVPVTEQMIDAIGATPREAYMGRDLLCVFDDVKIIENLNPDLSKVHALNGLLLHVTAKGAETDCVSVPLPPNAECRRMPFVVPVIVTLYLTGRTDWEKTTS